MASSPSSARRIALAVGLAVLAAVTALGALTHHERPLGVDPQKAVAVAARGDAVSKVIRPTDRVEVLRVDDTLVKVMWYRGDHAVATAGVDANKGVISNSKQQGAMGWGTAFSHALIPLAAFTLLFLLATVRAPLRANRLRTLDLLAIAALIVPAVLLDERVYGYGEGAMALLMLYLIARALTVAVRGPSPAEDPDAPVLLQTLAARLGTPHLVRQLGWALLAMTLIVTVTSTGIVDIAVADMEGATVLIGGHLPYGHMPGDIVHGDTYGLPVYAFYAPFAAIWPMDDDWDDPIGALVPTALLICLCAWAIARATERGAARWPAIIAFLAFPALLMSASSGTNDVLVAALLLWAFAWFRRPAASSALVMLAGSAKLAPLVLMPLWLARFRGRALVVATAASAAVGAAVLAGLVAVGGLHGPLDMADALAFQFSRVSELSVWTQVPLVAPLQPLAQGLTLAAALGGATLVLLDRDVAHDPRRVAALVTAVLAGLQLSANHWAPMYVLWLAPPVMLALAGPLGAAAPARARAGAPVALPAT